MRKNHVKPVAKFPIGCQFAFRRSIFRCRQPRKTELNPLIFNILSSPKECFSGPEMRFSAAVKELRFARLCVGLSPPPRYAPCPRR